MRRLLLDFLCCPACQSNLVMRDQVEIAGEIENGELICGRCNLSYPIQRSIPRFVPEKNYAANFGLQWIRFRSTQLDSSSRTTISHDRFFEQTGWSPDEMEGKRVLDVGCGAGRFSEICLSAGAQVVALDYSVAVDACWQNLGQHLNLNVVQGDIYCLPFKPAHFDLVYCFGVLQHTPDVKRAFMALPPQVADGGQLAVDIYLRSFSSLMHPKYWLRPITTRMDSDKLLTLVLRSAPTLLSISRTVGKVPLLRRYLKRLIPIANYDGIYPLSDQQLLEWAVLDTFDWLSPQYDQPKTAATLRRWLQQANLVDIEVEKAGHLVGRGRRP